jgi:hypothetical protein
MGDKVVHLIYRKIKNQFRESDWQRIAAPGAKTRILMTEFRLTLIAGLIGNLTDL